MSDSSDEGEYGFSWSSSEERSATPVMSECTAAMVLMNLSHAQMASKEATAMQQRMMQFIHRGSAAGGSSNSHASATAADAAAAEEAVAAAAEDTQNSPQGKNCTWQQSPNGKKSCLKKCRCIACSCYVPQPGRPAG